MENDLSYFMRRSAEERSAALNSQDLRATRSHNELAALFDDLVCRVTEKGEDHPKVFADVAANER